MVGAIFHHEIREFGFPRDDSSDLQIRKYVSVMYSRVLEDHLHRRNMNPGIAITPLSHY